MAEIIKIEIPADSSYLSVIRLAIAGLAAKINSDLETIEDLKVAVSESCLKVLRETERDTIELEIILEENCITIKNKGIKEKIDKGLNIEEDLNIYIIESLVDQLTYSDYGMEMKKNIGVET